MISISGKTPGPGEGLPSSGPLGKLALLGGSVLQAMLGGSKLPLAWDGSGSVSGPEPGLIAPSEVSPEE